MGLCFAFVLLTVIACRIQFNSGAPPVAHGQIRDLRTAWTPSDNTQYEQALGTPPYTDSRSGTALGVAKSMEDLEKELPEIKIPEVAEGMLMYIFWYIRYTKLLRDGTGSTRRLSWLYPDDGCEYRAELAIRAIFQEEMKLPKKVFVFGTVEAETENTKSKTVSWNHHVALIYRVEKIEYVLDPSLDPEKPFTLKGWNSALLKHSKDLKYSICNPTTYGRDGPCYQPKLWSHDVMIDAQMPFLQKERARLEELGKNADVELGTHAPLL